MSFTYEEVELLLNIAREPGSGATFAERLESIAEALSPLVPHSSLTAFVTRAPGSTGAFTNRFFFRNVSGDDLRSYARDYIKHDPMNGCFEGNYGTPALLSDFVPNRRFGSDPYTSDFLPRQGIRYIMGCVSPMPAKTLLAVAIQRERGLRDFSAKEVQALRLVSHDVAAAAYTSLLGESIDAGSGTAAEGPPARTGRVMLSALGEIVRSDTAALSILSSARSARWDAVELLRRGCRRIGRTSPAADGIEDLAALEDGRWLCVRLNRTAVGPRSQVLAVLHLLLPCSAELREALCDRAGLSQREREIAAAAVSGRGNRAIANALGITPVTVGVHLTRVFAKLRVYDRNDLTTYLLTGRRQRPSS